ncbi:MAG: OmpA family protein [Candidatus Omnitrophota bacterium]
MRKIAVLALLSFVISGCAVGFYKSNPKDKETIGQLSSEVDRLKKLKEDESRQLRDTMSALERELRKEIDEKQVRLEMAERGLVITFVTEILFDSGKTDIRLEGKQALDKVVSVLLERNIQQSIGIEGHTDNEPIKYSGWKSNWELSTARATSVLHYLQKKGLRPERLSATGYGEYRPLASNATVQGRQKNRRVEIVILPKYTKVKAQSGAK